jgi:hypothetical protein
VVSRAGEAAVADGVEAEQRVDDPLLVEGEPLLVHTEVRRHRVGHQLGATGGLGRVGGLVVEGALLHVAEGVAQLRRVRGCRRAAARTSALISAKISLHSLGATARRSIAFLTKDSEDAAGVCRDLDNLSRARPCAQSRICNDLSLHPKGHIRRVEQRTDRA